MRRAALLATLVGGANLVLPPPVGAQVGYLWSYEELLQKADLVLTAECQSTSETGRQRPHPDLKPGESVRELLTIFHASAVLRASQAVPIATEVRVRHYRWSDDVLKRGIANGGTWLRLEAHHNYLLFLTKASDGVYEPLSGHAFPNDSVYALDNMSAVYGESRWCCPTTR
jgi:hypothetical protein